MRFLVDNMLRCTLIQVCMRFHLKQQIQNVDQKQDLDSVNRKANSRGIIQLTMLVPLLICNTALSAVVLSVKEAWNAVYQSHTRQLPKLDT